MKLSTKQEKEQETSGEPGRTLLKLLHEPNPWFQEKLIFQKIFFVICHLFICFHRDRRASQIWITKCNICSHWKLCYFEKNFESVWNIDLPQDFWQNAIGIQTTPVSFTKMFGNCLVIIHGQGYLSFCLMMNCGCKLGCLQVIIQWLNRSFYKQYIQIFLFLFTPNRCHNSTRLNSHGYNLFFPSSKTIDAYIKFSQSPHNIRIIQQNSQKTAS